MTCARWMWVMALLAGGLVADAVGAQEIVTAAPQPAAEPAPALQTALAPAPLPDPAEVYAIPAELQALLEQKVLSQARYPQDRLDRLVEFMFEAGGMALQYDDHTRTVAQTFADRRGNCLAFTQLFVALAQAAGLDAEMQESENVLIAQSAGNSLIYTGHVSASVLINKRRQEVQFDPNNPIVKGETNEIGRPRALALYYNNRGAELMEAGHDQLAEQYFAQAAALAPELVPVWNNRGVLYLRRQQPERAERAFLTGLEHDPERLSVLANLVSLYRAEGDSASMQRYADRMAAAEARNPYYHFMQGLRLESEQRHREALSHYEAAAELDRKQPLYRLGQARCHAALGNAAEAARLVKRAQTLERRNAAPSRAVFMLRDARGQR